MAQSRFVNISSYCVVEYQAEDLGSSNYYNDTFILVENPETNTHQIFNDDSSLHTTKNIQDLSVLSIGNNTFAYLDSEKVPNYLDYNTALTVTTLPSTYNVVMDKVRFHFVSGFDFDDFRALVLTISNTENDGKNNIFANILLSPETASSLIIFNPKPLFLSNALYDRYIDILVPSIKNINEDYENASVQSNTFVAAITPNTIGSTGFIYNNPINITISECTKKKTINTNSLTNYDSYEADEAFTASISQSNEFDSVGAYINEADDADFLEFYLTFNSGFPEELISILNRRNPSDDWIIIHQLSIFEQVGSSFINTSRLVFFQEDKFDEPNVFRPVLKNAGEAVSMSVDYLVRLTNRLNGDQIIREASFNLISPKKYGKKLLNIQLVDKPQSQKVYNKIIKKSFEATQLFIEPEAASRLSNPTVTPTITEVIRTEYIPIFFNNNNISISNASSLSTTSDAMSEVIFGPGALRFILSPFDNILRLKVYTTTTSTTSNALVPLDLNTTAPSYKLSFETNTGKVEVLNSNDANQENLSTGLISFTVSKQNSESILKSTNKVVYLVSVSQDGTETLIYSGEWRKTTEQADVDAAIELAKNKSQTNTEIQTALTNIETLMASGQSKTSVLMAAQSSQIKNTAVASTVNRFGIANAKSIQPTISSVGTSGTSGSSNI
jgi:hypothetical protein